MENLKYPIGKYAPKDTYTPKELSGFIKDIGDFPKQLKKETAGLSESALLWRYRPDGWSIRQVVHHCADSHMNSVPRFKLALTEDNPNIKPYLEDKWAELADIDSPISYSLDLLTALHAKWVFLLKNLTSEDLKRTYVHPEHNRSFNLAQTMGLYAWHSNHHLTHVIQAKEKQFV